MRARLATSHEVAISRATLVRYLQAQRTCLLRDRATPEVDAQLRVRIADIFITLRQTDEETAVMLSSRGHSIGRYTVRDKTPRAD